MAELNSELSPVQINLRYHGKITPVLFSMGDWKLILSKPQWTITNCSRHDGCKQLYLKRRVRDENGRRVTQYLHRVIMNALPGFVVDHLNGDGLDNRRGNLRVTTQKENAKAERQNHKR